MKMKNNITAIALSAVMLASGVAYADDFDPKFYVGGELQANRMKGAKRVKTEQFGELFRQDKKPLFGKSGSGAGVMVGTRFCENIGLELGATGFSKTKLKFNERAFKDSQIKTKTHNIYGDVMGYLPVSEQIDLIGSVGVGRLTSKIKGNIDEQNRRGTLLAHEKVSMKSSKAGARVGLGVGYNIDKNLSARLMVRNQKGNKFVKSVTSASVGLIYSF